MINCKKQDKKKGEIKNDGTLVGVMMTQNKWKESNSELAQCPVIRTKLGAAEAGTRGGQTGTRVCSLSSCGPGGVVEIPGNCKVRVMIRRVL